MVLLTGFDARRQLAAKSELPRSGGARSRPSEEEPREGEVVKESERASLSPVDVSCQASEARGQRSYLRRPCAKTAGRCTSSPRAAARVWGALLGRSRRERLAPIAPTDFTDFSQCDVRVVIH